MFHPHIQASVGLTFNPNEPRVTARGGAFAEGEVGCFDFRRGDAATTNAKIGDKSSCFTNVVQAAVESQCRFGVFALFKQDTGDDQESAAIVSGRGKALLAETVQAGEPLFAAVGSKRLTKGSGAVDSHKCLAMTLEAFTYTGTPTLVDVAFDGSVGLGTYLDGVV